jgi:hypothetical protein
MAEIAGRKPKNRLRSLVEPFRKTKRTLREHYRANVNIMLLNGRPPTTGIFVASFPTGCATYRVERGPFCALFAATMSGCCRGTGVHQYTINQLLQDMIERCRKYRLRVTIPESRARQSCQLANSPDAESGPLRIL